MITIVIMMSGPQRLQVLAEAIDSIPITSPAISQVQLRCQGGPWDWGGDLRERFEQHPKFAIVEFPDFVDFPKSFNRTLDKVETPWALLLPDDDFLLRDHAAAAFESLVEVPRIEEYGFVAFGWYFLKGNRYLRSYVKKSGLDAVLHHTPKMCATLFNVQRVRQLGGFDDVGAFVDTAMFARLAYEFDGLISKKPVGVFRIHDEQASAEREKAYAPHVEALVQLLGQYASTSQQKDAFHQLAEKYGKGCDRPIKSWLQQISFPIRSRPNPANSRTAFKFRQWSAV